MLIISDYIKSLKKLSGLFIVLLVLNSCEFVEQVDPDGNDDPRDNIVDTWRSTEISDIYGKSSYLVDIAKEPQDSTGLILSNFYNLGVDAEVDGTLNGSKIIIPLQVVDGNQITGEGIISPDYQDIDFTYEVDDGSGEIDNASAEFSRM